MRIISGTLRGRKLAEMPHGGVRPTPDRVREALFNILGQNLAEMDFLDLFAGTGAVGLEAASRGARRVLLVDHDPAACETCQANVAHLEVGDRVTVTRGDVLATIPALGAREAPFDLVFADPPYSQEPAELGRLLVAVESSGLLAGGGTLVLQVRRGRQIPNETTLLEDRTRHYGITSILLYDRPT